MSILISPATVIRLDGDVSNSTTAFADATGLSFTATATSDYLIEAFLVYTSGATTTGLNLAITGPASPAGLVGEWQAYTSDTAILVRQFRAYDTGTATTGVGAASVAQYAQLTTMLRTGASGGLVTLRFASETTTAVTLKAGSILRVQQLAPVSTVNTIERFYAVVQLCQNLSTMQNNMRANVQGIQASVAAGTITTFAAAQQATRDLGTAFLQRLD